MNHIPPPPHSSGPSITGPRIRIDPSQMPNPVEAQEMDQNLYDEEDFLSCQTKGVIPLAGTDYRGIDQGELDPGYMRLTFRQLAPATSARDTTGRSVEFDLAAHHSSSLLLSSDTTKRPSPS
jgi:protein transport protein SEC24